MYSETDKDLNTDKSRRNLYETTLNVCFLCDCRYEYGLPKTEPSGLSTTQIHIFSSSNGHLITIFASSVFPKERLAFTYHSPTHTKP